MSRSRKKNPFWAVCGTDRDDKPLARRAVRRIHRQSLKTAEDFENFILPHRLECAHNETYSWGRDGGQVFQGFRGRDVYWYESQENALNKIAIHMRK